MRKFVLACALIAVSCASQAQQSVGIFTDHSDVGTVLHAGSTVYDSTTGTYTLRGSGLNMWSTTDAFQFAWKKMSGDVELSAKIDFPKSAGNPHTKAVLILRQSLDADSPYVDVAVHANGLGAFQYRDEKGAITRDIESSDLAPHKNWATGQVSQPEYVRIVRRGKYAYMFAGSSGDTRYDGESIPIPFDGNFYIGIGVCAHDENAIEEARFANVELRTLPPSTGQPSLYSTLEVVSISSGMRRITYFSDGRFEAPNWSRDGSYFMFNRNGHLEKIPVTGGTPTIINTGFANKVNNDHGISPDARQLAISDNSQETKSSNATVGHDSLVYVVPISGGTPRRLTQTGPSYWHGWSPDGKTLAFVGQRNGDFDIYTIPLAGGNETRLTAAKGLDDGPEYSPDGAYIYFNSERTGHMQIWRMKPDGSDQEQVFSDDYNNWFPHISADGKWMVFLTYEKDVTGHPENKDVMLRLMSLSDKKISVLAKLFGGQGTINVPSWSPDSKSLAFVSYALPAPEDAGK